MLSLLVWVPVAVSSVLGAVYVLWDDAGPAVKAAGVMAFLAAVYLQFYSRYPLMGLLLQVALALSLEIRRRVEMVSGRR